MYEVHIIDSHKLEKGKGESRDDESYNTVQSTGYWVLLEFDKDNNSLFINNTQSSETIFLDIINVFPLYMHNFGWKFNSVVVSEGKFENGWIICNNQLVRTTDKLCGPWAFYHLYCILESKIVNDMSYQGSRYSHRLKNYNPLSELKILIYPILNIM